MPPRSAEGLSGGAGPAGTSWRVVGLSLVVVVALCPRPAAAQSFADSEALLKVLGFGALAARPAAVAEQPRLDLNRATMRELATIPGIDHVLARKIILERPYAAIQELSRTGLTAAAIQRIAPFVTVAARATIAR